MSVEKIEFLFKAMCAANTDIHEHLPVMRKLIEDNKLEVVVELGVRDGNSTTAFLAAQPKNLISVDIVEAPFLWKVKDAYNAEPKGPTDWRYILADDLTIVIPECDLLFIDTNHTFEQLDAELKLHASKARKFIALHDTEAFKDFDHGWNKEGLGRAWLEFLRDNPQWKLHMQLKNCQGLTILKREV